MNQKFSIFQNVLPYTYSEYPNNLFYTFNNKNDKKTNSFNTYNENIINNNYNTINTRNYMNIYDTYKSVNNINMNKKIKIKKKVSWKDMNTVAMTYSKDDYDRTIDKRQIMININEIKRSKIYNNILPFQFNR